ncbi:hypothetical protein [Candidatus Thiosymbion oneisti]|nr:hypothetical protein [Candidatus Thiosymbion oneisti]
MTATAMPETRVRLRRRDREQLLRDAWLRHDALWFGYVSEHLDDKLVNVGNRMIVERLAEYEMLSLMRKLRLWPGNGDAATLKALFEIGIDLYQTRYSPVEIELLPGNCLGVSMHDCWACKAVREAGRLDRYRCGPWARLKGWLKAVGIIPKLKPDPGLCLALQEQGAEEVCRVEVAIP